METMIFVLAVLGTTLWLKDGIEKHIEHNRQKLYALNAIMKRQREKEEGE